MSEENTIEEGVLFAESLFGFHSRKPIVKISYGITFETMLSPAEARDFAASVLQAAEAAETDAFIVDWIKTSIGFTEDDKIVAVLRDFRKFREAQRENRQAENELPRPVPRAVVNDRRICKCNHRFTNHDGQGCKWIGCKCERFQER